MKKKTGSIAVVGLSGVFPKAPDIHSFLDHILEKKNCTQSVPARRWNIPAEPFLSQAIRPDTALCDKAGIIEHFNFSPDGFAIDPAVLAALDPVHQLVLKTGRDAFLQCRHTPEQKKMTGVILASIALPTDTSNRISSQLLFHPTQKFLQPQDAAACAMLSMPAAVLCRAMGFEAGCFTLDAACASSLVAVKLACEQLLTGKADIMAAGGVSRPDCLYTQIGFSQLNALSPTGVCSPFDEKADGLVVGEGAGILILKRIADAVADQDTIYAVIQGYGVSNDIEGTLVGPASEGQVRAMCSAYESADWRPSDIQYMECHGSGTPVGDQVELESIYSLLHRYGCTDMPLSIGSVKSMIGHLLTAAGSAGLIKTILAMNSKVLPPSLNYSKAPENCILNQSRIRVQEQPEEWKPSGPGQSRKAAVSAFGFGGINAHILIEEYNARQKRPAAVVHTAKPEIKNVPCAIVGIDTLFHNCRDINDYVKIVNDGPSFQPTPPDTRFRVAPGREMPQLDGYYLDDLPLSVGEFHIPPNQITDILPQHLYLLKSVANALDHAGIPSRPAAQDPARDRIGCAIGIEFDYGATDFRLRWNGHALDEAIREQISPALTFNRTLGALGGIVASRVARTFKLGGPCFTLSAAAASGFKAIETAVHSLSIHETDTYICGCVDLCGDLRQTLLYHATGRFNQTVRPSEGAATLILKRLDSAIEDNDRIYGVITGSSGSSGGPVPGESNRIDAHNVPLYEKSLDTALASAKTRFNELSFFETAFPNTHPMHRIEEESISRFQNRTQENRRLQYTCTLPLTGYTGCASGLFSMIHTLVNLNEHRQGKKETLKGCATAVTHDGCVSHIILETPGPHTADLSQQAAPDLKSQNNPVSVGRPQIFVTPNLRRIDENTHSIIQQHFYGIDRTDSSDRSGVNAVGSFDPGMLAEGSAATARAHEKFLEFSTQTMQLMEDQFKRLTALAHQVIHDPDNALQAPLKGQNQFSEPVQEKTDRPVFLDRSQCLEFAVGKAGKVLGPAFDEIDTYPVRVRLPDEPLMLVDRIISIEGEMLSLSSGKIITQHDVKQDAWYLDGGKTPVSISIEAGQADLFLCAWLGIDHAVKGTRKYRLLDAKVTFHRTLPEPEETIEYHIEIDRFLKQGEVFLFFFHYRGYIGDQLLISMRDGCAGFFTDEEVKNSGGIILRDQEKQIRTVECDFAPFCPFTSQALSEQQVDALRKGDLFSAFGRRFEGITLGRKMRLPDGKMHLIDRVLDMRPDGGRYGLGSITAEADIHPDDWFLTCHFIDDMVMPGTLMYECCAHALRILTQQMGWISEKDDICYDVVLSNESDLKCRGPVTPQTRKARYEIEIKWIGYDPEPFVIADAHMFSDDLRIVLYRDMGMKIAGLTQAQLIDFWRDK